jgi:hypothetical protein
LSVEETAGGTRAADAPATVAIRNTAANGGIGRPSPVQLR